MIRHLQAIVVIAVSVARRAVGDRRLLLVGSIVPVVLIFGSGLLTGGSRVPLGVVLQRSDVATSTRESVASSAPILSLLNHLGSVKIRLEGSQSSLTDDILRGRVVAGLVIPLNTTTSRRPSLRSLQPGQKPDPSSSSSDRHLVFIAQSAQPAVFQAYSSVVVAINLLSADARATSATRTPLTSTIAATNSSLKKLRQPNPISPFSYVGPADLVLFTGITALVLSAGLVEMRRRNILRRTLAAPLTSRDVATGQILGIGIIAVAQSTGLIVLGDFLFKIKWGDPIATLMIVASLSLAFASASTLLGSIARTNEQAVAVGAIVALAGGMLGGCLWPLSVVNPSIAAIGDLTPQAWAMDGFIRLIYANSGILGVLPDIAILLAIALVLSVLAQWRLRRIVV
ncbi:MAG: ABC transporter permease [Acidimicrobiales bacterium]